MTATFWIKALQLILALSFLVLIHEAGHMFFAKLFRVRVEKFYMFFNPKFSLFRMKKIGGKWRFRFFAPNVESNMVEQTDAFGNPLLDKKGQPLYRTMTEDEINALPEDDWRREPQNTEWGIGWLPLGGYCSIAGMVDETKTADNLPSEPQAWEFRSRNVWQRMCIIMGGILVNFIAALIIFGQLLFHYGETSLPLRNIDRGLYFSEIFLREGFEQQDRILTIDGQEPTDVGDIVQKLIIEGKQSVVVLRAGDTLRLTMSDDLGTRYLARQSEFDYHERKKARRDRSYQKRQNIVLCEYFPFVIDSVLPNSTADLAGLQKGDSVVSIADVVTPSFAEVQNELQKHPCENITICAFRNDSMICTEAFLGDQCKLGVYTRSKYDYFPVEHRNYSFLQSIPAGIKYGWDMLVMYVHQFRLIFTKEGAQSLGGFGAIGNMFPSAWDWATFWHMTAFLSLILAFMNFLPIPALDGGYILFLLFEILTGKKPSDSFLEKANTVGFWLLLALMIFANGNDIFKIFF